MCRSTDFQGLYYYFNSDKDRLKVKSFFVTLTNFQAKKKLPESVTLLYLPRINETALEISGKYIRPDTPAYVTLHRVVVVTEEEGGGGGGAGGEVITYGSRERAVVTEAVSFEVYIGEEKALKGIYRRDEEGEWKLECKCVMERAMEGTDDVANAEVYVGLDDGDGRSAMIERVEMVVKHKRRRKGAFCNFELEEIPEEREGVDSVDCCCCCSSRGKMMESSISESDGEEAEEEDDEGELDLDLDLEGVRWAVDVGIWVMCLGLGYFVSKAAFARKSLRRKTILF